MKILSRPKGNAEEYGKWSVNPYVGCPHGCKYCYLKKGVWANTLGGSVPTLKEHILNEYHAVHQAMVEIYDHREQIIKDGGLFMTFTSDPCAKETREVFFKIIEESTADLGIPVTILTKNADFTSFWRYSDIITDAMRCIHPSWITKRLLAVGWTLTGHDEMEPNAATNEERINAMRISSLSGIKTWASIEPVIDFDASFKMIQQALDAGCRHFKIGLMTKNTKVCRNMYDHDACITFIHDVMRTMGAGGGTATVYWKQSFRDFLGEEDFTRATVGYKNIVGKDWSMFQ